MINIVKLKKYASKPSNPAPQRQSPGDIEKRNELKRKIPPQNLHTINKEITDQYENAKRRRMNSPRASNTPRTPHAPRTTHVGKVKDIINGKVRVRCLKEDYGSVLDAAEYERENDAVFYD